MKIDVQGVDATDLTPREAFTLTEMVSDAVEADTSQSPGHVEILTDDGVVLGHPNDGTGDGDSA